MMGYSITPPDPHLLELLTLITHRLLALEGTVRGMQDATE